MIRARSIWTSTATKEHDVFSTHRFGATFATFPARPNNQRRPELASTVALAVTHVTSHLAPRLIYTYQALANTRLWQISCQVSGHRRFSTDFGRHRHDIERNQKMNNPFLKQFTIGLAIYVAFAAMLMFFYPSHSAFILGALFPAYFTSATISSVWEFFTKNKWSWLRSIYTEAGLFIFVNWLAVQGALKT